MFGIKQIPSLFRIAATTTEGSLGLAAPWSVAEQRLLRRRSEQELRAVADQCSCSLALTGNGDAYNEEAFRYLLEVERKRFEASNQPFVLVLVDLTRHLGQGERMTAAIGAKVLASLTRSLRDTDLIGWYRQGRTVGAVLTHLGEAPLADVSQHMTERVRRALRTGLSKNVTRHLKVRLYQPKHTTQ
jgi:hypothetical protein